MALDSALPVLRRAVGGAPETGRAAPL